MEFAFKLTGNALQIWIVGRGKPSLGKLWPLFAIESRLDANLLQAEVARLHKDCRYQSIAAYAGLRGSSSAEARLAIHWTRNVSG